MYEKTIVAIPCLNESKNIKNAISLIRKTGFDGTILVIDDGSTDNTSRIAKENGAEVVKMPKNVGKAAATFAAFKEGLKRNCSALVTLDADLIQLPKRDLDILISEAKKATLAKKMRMAVAYCHERGGITWLSADISGARAYSRAALYKVLGSKDKGKVKGFGIEQFLNLELGEKGVGMGFMSDIITGPPLRLGERQNKEIQKTLKNLRKRIALANEERMARIKQKLKNGEYKFQKPRTKEQLQKEKEMQRTLKKIKDQLRKKPKIKSIHF